MKLTIILLTTFALLCVSGGCAESDGRRWSPAQVALITPVQIAPPAWDVYGLCTNLMFCGNHDFAGLGVGSIDVLHRSDGLHADLLGITEWGASGLEISGLANSAVDEMTGLQVATIINAVVRPPVEDEGLSLWDTSEFGAGLASGSMHGAQVSIFWNVAREMSGVQVDAGTVWPLALLAASSSGDLVQGSMDGAQVSPLGINVTAGTLRGVQIAGIGSKAGRLRGVQIGLINEVQLVGGWIAGTFNSNLTIGEIAGRAGEGGADGVQVGGICNLVRLPVRGVQVAESSTSRGTPCAEFSLAAWPMILAICPACRSA